MIAIPHLKGIVLETYGAGNSPGKKGKHGARYY
jgi:L-asparaginase/Glu-tRNA(Gln) amidotransferase subunit D